MTNAELADKYEKGGYIDIASDMDAAELKQVIAALRAPRPEVGTKRFRLLDMGKMVEDDNGEWVRLSQPQQEQS